MCSYFFRCSDLLSFRHSGEPNTEYLAYLVRHSVQTVKSLQNQSLQEGRSFRNGSQNHTTEWASMRAAASASIRNPRNEEATLCHPCSSYQQNTNKTGYGNGCPDTTPQDQPCTFGYFQSLNSLVYQMIFNNNLMIFIFKGFWTNEVRYDNRQKSSKMPGTWQAFNKGGLSQSVNTIPQCYRGNRIPERWRYSRAHCYRDLVA